MDSRDPHQPPRPMQGRPPSLSPLNFLDSHTPQPLVPVPPVGINPLNQLSSSSALGFTNNVPSHGFVTRPMPPPGTNNTVPGFFNTSQRRMLMELELAEVSRRLLSDESQETYNFSTMDSWNPHQPPHPMQGRPPPPLERPPPAPPVRNFLVSHAPQPFVPVPVGNNFLNQPPSSSALRSTNNVSSHGGVPRPMSPPATNNTLPGIVGTSMNTILVEAGEDVVAKILYCCNVLLPRPRLVSILTAHGPVSFALWDYLLDQNYYRWFLVGAQEIVDLCGTCKPSRSSGYEIHDDDLWATLKQRNGIGKVHGKVRGKLIAESQIEVIVGISI